MKNIKTIKNNNPSRITVEQLFIIHHPEKCFILI